MTLKLSKEDYDLLILKKLRQQPLLQGILSRQECCAGIYQNQVLLVAFNNRSIVVVFQALMINGRFFRIVPVAHKNQLCHEANFQWRRHIHGTHGDYSHQSRRHFKLLVVYKPVVEYQWMESNFQWRILSTHQLPKLQFKWIPSSRLENWLWTLWEQNSALD